MRSVGCSYFRTVVTGCIQHGADADSLYALIEDGERALQNPARRFSTTTFINVLNTAVRLTGDETLGLKVGLSLRPETFEDVGFAIAFCDDLPEVMATNAKYQGLTQQLGTSAMEVSPNAARVSWKPYYKTTELHRYYVDLVFAGYATIGRWLVWQAENPILSMTFRHSPPQDMTVYTAVFGDNVRFDARFDRLSFQSEVAMVPIPTRNPEMKRLLIRRLEKQLSKLNQPHSLSEQTQLCIQTLLNHGRPSIGQVAEIMGQTERTFRRRLSEQNVSFRELLENARRDACEVHLRKGGFSHAQIAQALGFSDQSAYTRAFKAWFGVTPRAYRESIHENLAAE